MPFKRRGARPSHLTLVQSTSATSTPEPARKSLYTFLCEEDSFLLPPNLGSIAPPAEFDELDFLGFET